MLHSWIHIDKIGVFTVSSHHQIKIDKIGVFTV